MNIRERADKTTQDVLELVGKSGDIELATKITDVVERELVRMALEARNWCADKAMERSGGEKDLAHDISDELRRETEALITNLSSMQ